MKDEFCSLVDVGAVLEMEMEMKFRGLVCQRQDKEFWWLLLRNEENIDLGCC